MPHPEVGPAETRDWRPLLDRELALLPQKYQAAIVLCDLEGRSRKEAARQLGLTEGTLSGSQSVVAATLSTFVNAGVTGTDTFSHGQSLALGLQVVDGTDSEKVSCWAARARTRLRREARTAASGHTA
jgi:hypothetical protein